MLASRGASTEDLKTLEIEPKKAPVSLKIELKSCLTEQFSFFKISNFGPFLNWLPF